MQDQIDMLIESPQSMGAEHVVDQIARIFSLVQEKSPDLAPSAGWLLVSSHLAAAVLDGAEPKASQLRDLQRFLADEDPGLGDFLGELAKESPKERIYADLVLERLYKRRDWRHPSQIVRKPPLEDLLSACRRRLERSSGQERRRLLEIQQKVERAVRLSKKAARRRAAQPQRKPLSREVGRS